MEIFYCPSYKDFVYADFSELIFNETFLDTKGLLDLLSLHAGLSFDKKEDLERSLDYYKAMKIYMEKNPDNLFSASFDVDPLSVAKECLKWRDTLTFASWSGETKTTSERFKALSQIEKYFSDPSLGQQLSFVTEAVKNNCLLPDDLEIAIPFDYKLFSPLEAGLLDALKNRGVNVFQRPLPKKEKNALSSVINLLEGSEKEKVNVKKDDSFSILHFVDENQAALYLSLKDPSSYTVWINSNSKLLDNYLTLEGKAVSGSTIKGCMPQILQILLVGLSTLSRPLNLKNLIEWLNVPLSPLPVKFSKALEKKILKNGGYYNDDCKRVISNFINCEFDFEDLPEEERLEKIKVESKKRKILLENFLPDVNDSSFLNDEKIQVAKVKSFVENLYKWCAKERQLLENINQKAEVTFLLNECVALLNMLDCEKDDRLSFEKLMTFVSALNEGKDVMQYEAEESSRFVIENPGQLACPVESLIWCDFYNAENEKLKYDFLFPNEKEEFKKSLMLWDEECEKEYNRKIKLLPFYYAKKITLLVVDRKGVDNVEKDPVFIQLENKIENIKDFIVSPEVGTEHKNLLKEAPLVNNGMNVEDEGLVLKNASLIKWPERETFSSLEQLVYNPFDYLFSTIAGISSYGNSALPDIYQVHGSLAHAVIENLFNKKEGVEESGTPSYIKKNIKKNFDKVFEEMVNAKGAILLLKENILNLENYKNQVFVCVNALVKVLEENQLSVLACEPWLENSQMNFPYDIGIGGYADMILLDKKNNPLVFDFKWSPGRENKFKKIIKENKSIQLELYKYLTKEVAQSNAKAVAYVILPDVTLVSDKNFIGDNTIKVLVDNADEELLPKVKNSYRYRRSQIESGFVEEATGFTPDMIAYARDTEKENLIPLDFGDKKALAKAPKAFAQYDFFKQKKNQK